MSYLLPKGIENSLIDCNDCHSTGFYLFRDKEEPCESDDSILHESNYLAEGWIDGIFHDNAKSGKQACCFWVSPTGDIPSETNWRSFEEIEIFAVSETVYREVIAFSERLDFAFETAFDLALKVDLPSENLAEFDFDREAEKYICRDDPLVTVEWHRPESIEESRKAHPEPNQRSLE
jgi:hypothetical protein